MRPTKRLSSTFAKKRHERVGQLGLWPLRPLCEEALPLRLPFLWLHRTQVPLRGRRPALMHPGLALYYLQLQELHPLVDIAPGGEPLEVLDMTRGPRPCSRRGPAP